jgi:lysophospholipase L1-like esterase
VADWADTSAENRDYMVKDGVHLTTKGAREFTRIIAEAAGVQTEQ